MDTKQEEVSRTERTLAPPLPMMEPTWEEEIRKRRVRGGGEREREERWEERVESMSRGGKVEEEADEDEEEGMSWVGVERVEGGEGRREGSREGRERGRGGLHSFQGGVVVCFVVLRIVGERGV